ncbi:ATP-binding protein, partial [Undibacterium sp. Di27W]
MFTQVDRTLEKTTGGLGIGLSLVKGLVHMHGGTISAFSEGEGKGSKFAVRLPLSTSALTESDLMSAESPRIEPRRFHRILIIDDNEDAANALGQLLEMMDNEVATAYDGETGFKVARAFQPGIV